MEQNILLTLLQKNIKKPGKTAKTKTSKKLNTEMLLNPLRLNVKNDILTSAKKAAPQTSESEVMFTVSSYLKKNNITLEDFATLNPDYYSMHNPMDHSQRVLLYAAYIAIIEKIPLKHFNVLVNAAKLHDIGRNSDKTDLLHGHKGASIIKKYNLVDLEKPLFNILLTLVDSHSAYDKNIEGVMFKHEIELKDYPAVKKLCNIIKDAEALDKVRFIDEQIVNVNKILKVNQLKLKTSKQLVTLAFDMLEHYKDKK